MRAEFTGKNGSQGFRTGHTYDIVISAQMGLVYLETYDKRFNCYYESFEKLLENWRLH